MDASFLVSFWLLVCFFTVCLSNCPFLRQLAFSSACPFESMCKCYLFICLSDCLRLCLFVYLSRCSSVCYVLVLVLLLRLWHFEAASDSLNGSIVTASSRSNPGGFLFPGNRYFWATGASHGRTDGRTDRWTDGRTQSEGFNCRCIVCRSTSAQTVAGSNNVHASLQRDAWLVHESLVDRPFESMCTCYI